jgi:hypothetical protein
VNDKYYLEIDTGGAEASGYEDVLPWVSYGTIVAFGNSLDECLSNAGVDLVDQDGGEAGQVEADADWMQDLVREAFRAKYGIEDQKEKPA